MGEVDDAAEKLADNALGFGKLRGKRFADVAEESFGSGIDGWDVGIFGVDEGGNHVDADIGCFVNVVVIVGCGCDKVRLWYDGNINKLEE